MSFLPPGLEPPGWITFTAAYFFIGLLIGLAAKKALAAVIMILIAVIIAIVLLGFSIAIDAGSLIGRGFSLTVDLYGRYGAALSTYPISLAVGIFVGLWKGKG